MDRWLVEVRSVDGRVLQTEGYLLRRSAERAAASHNAAGRELARLVTAGWTDDQRATVPSSAYTAEVRRA